jgi:UDP-N-acetylglucosamine 2-epimerase (non-hydrolysing)
MKAAPLCKTFTSMGMPYKVYHSGQHHDQQMSAVFQEQFDMSNVLSMECDIKDNAVRNIQKIVFRAHTLLKEEERNIRCVVVFGDVLTTYAVTLAAHRLNLPIAHVESGLRSFDISMPEELTRIAVDHMSDFLFCPSADAVENLKQEGIPSNTIHMVGNIMIDSLIACKEKIDKVKIDVPKEYIVATFHRPENIDDDKRLAKICDQLSRLSTEQRIIFPVHPRTLQRLNHLRLYEQLIHCDIEVMSPLGYFEFMKYVSGASAVITDSGGIQEETTYLGVKCFTVRNNTERPITITLGTNKLISYEEIYQIVKNRPKKTIGIIPQKWDGATSRRIANILNDGC